MRRYFGCKPCLYVYTKIKINIIAIVAVTQKMLGLSTPSVISLLWCQNITEIIASETVSKVWSDIIIPTLNDNLSKYIYVSRKKRSIKNKVTYFSVLIRQQGWVHFVLLLILDDRFCYCLLLTYSILISLK